jgi:hypothetical protein
MMLISKSWLKYKKKTGGGMNKHLTGALIACVLTFSATSASAAPVNDLGGDTVAGAFATYDILSIDALFTVTDVTFTVNLSSNPLAPSAAGTSGLNGFIDIDIDTNAATGITSNIDTLPVPFGNTGLGMEYSLKLSSESSHAGFVDLFDPIFSTTTTAPITYGLNMFSIKVLLSQLGNDDGLLSYSVAVGDSANVTDQAVDAGGLAATSSLAPAVIPLPAALWLFGSALGLLGWKRRIQN